MALVTADAFLVGFIKQVRVTSVTNLLGSANIIKGTRRPLNLANPSITVTAEPGPLVQDLDLMTFYANVVLYVGSQRLGTFDGSTFSAVSSAVIATSHGVSWTNSPARCHRSVLIESPPSPMFDPQVPEEHWLPLRFRCFVSHT